MSQTKTSDAAQIANQMEDSTQELLTQQESDQNQQQNPTLSEHTLTEVNDKLTDEQKNISNNLSMRSLYDEVIKFMKENKIDPGILAGTKDWPDVAKQSLSLNPVTLRQQATDLGIRDIDTVIKNTSNVGERKRNIFRHLNQYLKNQRLYPKNNQNRTRTSQFNFRKYKLAQNTSFPVIGPDDFVAKFLDKLLLWNGKQNTNSDTSDMAVKEIQDACGQGFQTEANDALEKIQQLDYSRQDEGKEILYAIYHQWLSPNMKVEAGSKKMDTPGIIKHNLSDHIIKNDQVSNCENMIKTAADHFGQEYVLYGPAEKRICPKLRGRGGGPSGSGDVVSEYVCRHHCLDSIVIDDNKTACGEAIWRANVMDKQAREYIDADGNITGGYTEKRFEVNHNVPEENKMRLKPGEIRKDRPVELFGNMEARLQKMRKEQGDKRKYRPTTNKGNVFNWAKDQDQNNVEVSQSERDQREENMGHQTVQYTNKTELENNPKMPTKTAFNLKQYKQASLGQVEINHAGYPEKLKTMSTEQLKYIIRDARQALEAMPDGPKAGYYQDEISYAAMELKRRQSKQAQIIPDDGIADGGEPYTKDEMGFMQSDLADDETDLTINEPQEEDIICDDQGGPFWYTQKIIANTVEELKKWMEKNNYFPDVWWISDHGNSLNITRSIMEDSEDKPLLSEPEHTLSESENKIKKGGNRAIQANFARNAQKAKKNNFNLKKYKIAMNQVAFLKSNSFFVSFALYAQVLRMLDNQDPTDVYDYLVKSGVPEKAASEVVHKAYNEKREADEIKQNYPEPFDNTDLDPDNKLANTSNLKKKLKQLK